jgi:hypothetical protein
MNRIIYFTSWSVFCICVGIWIGHPTQRRSFSASPSSAALRQLGERPSVSALVEQVAGLPQPKTETSFSTRLKSLLELNQFLKFQPKISVPLFNGDTINQDFVALFDLSPQQIDKMRNLVSAVKMRIAQIEAAHAVIEPKGDSEFLISVPPFPTEGGLVYNDMLDSIRKILGDERYVFYMAMPSHDLESTTFRGFGLSESMIDLKPFDEKNGTASGSFTVDPETKYIKSHVYTNSELFPEDYPELYKKMVNDGLWKPSPTRR